MNSFEVREFVIVRVDADAEEETCVAAVDYFVVSELRVRRAGEGESEVWRVWVWASERGWR